MTEELMNEVESFREKQHGPHRPKLHDPALYKHQLQSSIGRDLVRVLFSRMVHCFCFIDRI
ncbi:hypothetical protein MTR_4g009810 [Medicago truncatula]|uniref:Uncharacterized protein n=1 Tax=Medicago truncatula TaxID=3880 RepID=G7JGU7_MEDTR|nr:hypothetical protein MTR_4g009810 [Medicago truncatula]